MQYFQTYLLQPAFSRLIPRNIFFREPVLRRALQKKKKIVNLLFEWWESLYAELQFQMECIQDLKESSVLHTQSWVGSAPKRNRFYFGPCYSPSSGIHGNLASRFSIILPNNSQTKQKTCRITIKSCYFFVFHFQFFFIIYS